MIDPNDPIEKLVIESVQLGEKVRARPFVMTDKERAMYKEMDTRSEELWKEAKRLGAPHVTQKNYEDRANAILHRAIEDYEDLMCKTKQEGGDSMSMSSIENFLKRQTYSRLNMIEMLERIKTIYHTKFYPYCAKHAKEISEQWAQFDKSSVYMNLYDREKATKHRCPLCGGALRPISKQGYYNIGCTGCHLAAYLPGMTQQALKEKFYANV